ncbi:MAG: hypothetical protein L3K19_09150 [Thermoplasmata archaeon]|nr:hypothetical protein [Thermoplasmata archaeon]
MSINPPRYAAGPMDSVGRPQRALAIYLQELRVRAGAGTWFVLALMFGIISLIVVLVSFETPPSQLALSIYFAPFGSPAFPLLILIVTTSVGSGALAEDLGNRSITLYLSRPIHLSDYLAAKGAAVGSYVALASIGPGVVGVIVVAALGVIPGGLAVSAIGAFFAVGFVTTVFFTGLALALSALTNKALYAGVGIFGSTLAAETAARVIGAITGNHDIVYVAPFYDVQAAASGAFQANTNLLTNPLGSALLLAGAGLLLLVVVWVRMTRVEVVGE